MLEQDDADDPLAEHLAAIDAVLARSEAVLAARARSARLRTGLDGDDRRLEFPAGPTTCTLARSAAGHPSPQFGGMRNRPLRNRSWRIAKWTDGPETIMQFLHAGDELVVLRLDRLGRSTRDVLNLVHELDEK